MHIPVLLNEVLKIFDPKPGQIYIDATVNGGGHAFAILERIGPEGKLLGIDWDCDIISKIKNPAPEGRGSLNKVERQKSNIKNLILTCDNYANVKSIAGKHNLGKIDGVLFDLGFSLYHIEESRRGFSFLRNEPLDMRYNPDFNDLTAKKIVNEWPLAAIEDILREYGEERFARRIARGIVYAREYQEISTTNELVQIVSRSVPPKYRFGRGSPRRGGPRSYLRRKIHPATKTFQALRIAVNDELENLRKGLLGSIEILKHRGKIVVISFHSLEDRIVKGFLKEKKEEGAVAVITKKPIRPSMEEIKINARARSAKLRAAQKK